MTTTGTTTEASAAASAEGRDGLVVLAILGSVVAVIVALVGVGFGMRAVDEAGGGGTGLAATGEPVTFDIELGDLYVRPASIDVPAGSEVIVNVSSTRALRLDLFPRTGVLALLAGASDEEPSVVCRSTRSWRRKEQPLPDAAAVNADADALQGVVTSMPKGDVILDVSPGASGFVAIRHETDPRVVHRVSIAAHSGVLRET